MPIYTYRPIVGEGGIRLVSLTSLRDGTPKCNITHTTLKNAPTYEALSYTWGDVKDSIPLLVDDNARLMISQNLFGALRQLAAHNNNRLFWIDQLCINQIDVAEKEHQVQQMTQIYEKSSLTIIWLGEDNGESSQLFQLISQLQRLLGNPQTLQSPATAFNYSKNTLSELMRQGIWDELLPVSRRLLARKWFERAWVFQEAVVSPKIVFLMGSYHFPWDQVVRILFLFQTSDSAKFTARMRRTFELLGRMNSSRHLYAEQKKIPLAILLKEGSGAKCSNPRDLIYSLLGMAEEEKTAVPIDYTVPVSTLFVDTTRFLVRRHKNLAVLATIEDMRIATNLPSWTPDWSFGTFAHCLDITPEVRPSYYNAAKGFAHRALLSEVSTYLVVNGKVVDSVQEVLDHNFENLHCEDILNKFPVKKVFENLHSYLERRAYLKPPHRTLLAAVIRSMIGGHILFASDVEYLRRLPPDADVAEMFVEYSEKLLLLSTTETHREMSWHGKSFQDSPELQVITTMILIATNVCEKRRIVFNRRFPIGLAPRNTRPGDLICILHGATVPCVLRPEGEFFRWIGNCYVNAIMHGEAVEWEEDEADTFVLV